MVGLEIGRRRTVFGWYAQILQTTGKSTNEVSFLLSLGVKPRGVILSSLRLGQARCRGLLRIFKTNLM